MTTQTSTLTLTEHPERGWKVDPDTGEAFGPRNWNYKITPTVHAQVLARLAAGESGASIGRDIGVSDQTISRIKRGERCPS